MDSTRNESGNARALSLHFFCTHSIACELCLRRRSICLSQQQLPAVSLPKTVKNGSSGEFWVCASVERMLRVLIKAQLLHACKPPQVNASVFMSYSDQVLLYSPPFPRFCSPFRWISELFTSFIFIDHSLFMRLSRKPSIHVLNILRCVACFL